LNPADQQPESFRFTHTHSLMLVFFCTLFGVGAQFLIKTSANQMASITLESLLTNWALWGGLALYGISTGLLILALRDGELSLLYPVISLTYVWVTILSVTVFDERLTWTKAIGVSIIVIGVGLLGKGRE
jgi:multidrug transporter EmrE-like cation transporter